MFRLKPDSVITPELLVRLIEKFSMEELPRLEKLKRYYLNKTDILNRVELDPSKPNNKIAHPFAQLITDTLASYFMGEPVVYTSTEDIEDLKMIYTYNDEQDENMELAKSCSIFGSAWELLYVDFDGSIRFKSIDTREIIPIYNDTLDNELLYVVRFFKEYDIMTDKFVTNIEVYTDKEISYYTAGEKLDNITFNGSVSHAFGSVPFVEYKNNEDNVGDFEQVITLIDAYDALVSDSINEYDYFVDAYLALYGYTADADDVAQMKQNRVLLMDVDTKAEFITKQNNSNDVDVEKSRLEQDIHKFSKCPNSSDENFSGNASGVAMKYKLLGTENLGSIKERKFKRGLMARIELIAGILALTKSVILDPLEVEIAFTRNLPVNESELVATVKGLTGLVSKKTLLAQLPFIEDAEAELQQLEAEQKSSIYYTGFQSMLGNNDATEEEVVEE